MSNKNEQIVDLVNQIVAEYKPQTFDWYEPSLDNRSRITGILIDGFRKFVTPDPTMENGRRDRAINGYFADNGRIGSHDLVFQPGLLQFLRDFIAQSIGRDRLRDEDAWFGPGQSFFSTRESTTAYSKLVSSMHYSVTLGALPHMAKVLERSNLFQEYFKHGLERYADDINSYRSAYLDRLERFRRVAGNRVSTVPKNANEDRSIGVEPLLNMMYQKQIGALLRRACARKGNCLDTGQDRHRELIKRRVATIDLKSASNSLSWLLVQTVCPRWLVRHISAARVKFSYDQQNHNWHTLHMVSSMGNGFTFELMSLILLGVTRYYSAETSVFGDDIIVPLDVAPEVVEAITGLGFLVNTRKSFFDGVTRESCGAFMVAGVEVTRYDIKYAEDISDAVITRNKVYRLYNAAKLLCVHDDVVKALRKLNRKLTDALRKVNIPFGPVILKHSNDWDSPDNQGLAICLETSDEKLWYVPTTPQERQVLKLIRDRLQLRVFGFPSLLFTPKIRREFTVANKNGPIAILCAIKGEGAPNLTIRDKGRIDKKFVVICELGTIMVVDYSKLQSVLKRLKREDAAFKKGRRPLGV